MTECIARVQEGKKNHEQSWDAVDQLARAAYLLGIIQIVLVILFGTVGGSQVLDPYTAPGTATQGYNMFIGVEIMMFVGFGYLMTFLKWYGLGAVGLTALVTAIGLQWALFTESFWGQLYNNSNHWHSVDVTIYSLLNALYAISAVLISFGAIIGKVSPFQLVLMTGLELICQSFNYKVLMEGVMNVQDLGGTYSDHMFGAYFGLAVAYMLGPPTTEPEFGSTPDVFSLIGTLFLWVYWPSFVAGAGPADSEQQQRALVNTVLSLAASTVGTFWLSMLMSRTGRIRPVDIQNATLAGGVAIGCTANLGLSVLGAVLIGLVAGIVSTVGYNVLSPFLERRCGLHDTCGIHNLHALPSVVGGLASVVLAAISSANGGDSAIYGQNELSQWWRQLVGVVLCVCFAIVSGTIVGFVLKAVDSKTEGDIKPFHDECYWEVAEDYGRSLYTELAAMLPPGGGGPSQSGRRAAEEAAMNMSSHHGRRIPRSGLNFFSQSGHDLSASLHHGKGSHNLHGHSSNPTLSNVLHSLSTHGHSQHGHGHGRRHSHFPKVESFHTQAAEEIEAPVLSAGSVGLSYTSASNDASAKISLPGIEGIAFSEV